MIRAIRRQLLTVLPTLVIILLLVFLMVDLMPGDPVEIAFGDAPNVTEETMAELRAELGLDRPMLVRFGDYLTDLVQGDLGRSIHSRRPVLTTLLEGLRVTGSLGLVSMVMTIVLALVFGSWAGLRPGRLVDRAVSGGAAFGLAIPSFVFALLLVIPLALHNSWFPATGYRPLEAGFLTWLHHLLLPSLALAVNSAAELTRQVRGALVETMEKDYIRTGRALGLAPLSVVGKHAARNSAIPVVTVTGLQVARILGSAVIIERVFAMPGFGSAAYTAVLRQDLPLIQGVVLVSAIIVLTTNILVDLSYAYLNPRLRV